MVTKGEVTRDCSYFENYMKNYQTEVSQLTGDVWAGLSHDNLLTMAEDFVSEYSVISSQMNSFAEACGYYSTYVDKKNKVNSYISQYNSSTDREEKSSLDSTITSLKSELQQLETNITNSLRSASSPSLSATSISASSSSELLSIGGTNIGAMPSAVVKKAIEKAMAIADDNNYGYITGGMGDQNTGGNGLGYDCTQFVHACFVAAGIPIPYDGGYINPVNIREEYTKLGFEWFDGPVDVNQLQPGDVLVRYPQHAELYIGNGMKAGAHDNYSNGPGDPAGNEISIDPFGGSWTGYLRYTK